MVGTQGPIAKALSDVSVGATTNSRGPPWLHLPLPALPPWRPPSTTSSGLLFRLVGDVAGEPVPYVAVWPGESTWALVLTHDVERRVGYDGVDLPPTPPGRRCLPPARLGSSSSPPLPPRV